MSVGLSKLGSSSGECGKTVIVKHAGGKTIIGLHARYLS